MTVSEATNQELWDAFLSRQRFRPFLQSWAMGEVYRDIGQQPVRLVIEDQGVIQGICFGHIVDARRGRHLSVPYGPMIRDQGSGIRDQELLFKLIDELKRIAKSEGCSFIRLSPFWPESSNDRSPIPDIPISHSVPSPLHLLAEQVWYLPLTNNDQWIKPELPATSYPPAGEARPDGGQLPASPERVFQPQTTFRSEEGLLMAMRKTTRNLIRRAERDGVEVTASVDPLNDLEIFIKLHDETRKRHGFTPYSNAFFRSQVKHFAANNQCTVYLAKHQGEILATSVHMHAFGETSYHHGASVQSKVPASYLLQWRAIQDALRRGDHVYNFWGIAPASGERLAVSGEIKTDNDNVAQSPKPKAQSHPFAGVTLFKTGFGGSMLPLTHCRDLPLKPTYWLTYAFETVRKWKRGF
jgi:lipid II:glycine glycyltransferase (peptidoglycan interpeptide bridge formation enzyme)